MRVALATAYFRAAAAIREAARVAAGTSDDVSQTRGNWAEAARRLDMDRGKLHHMRVS